MHRRVLSGAAALLTFLVLAATAAAVSTPRPEVWIANDDVRTVAVSGRTAYIGGRFDRVSPATGHGVPFSTTTGAPVAAFPRVGGRAGFHRVRVAIPDGSGGWFVGGDFTHVGGLPRAGLAHILADGTVDPGFAPAVTGSQAQVRALALAGGLVVVGGNFEAIGGVARTDLAAVDATSGAVATAFAPEPNDEVEALLNVGGALYVGGSFTQIGGGARDRLAQLDPATGALVATWDPDIDDGTVFGLAEGGGDIYAVGGFSQVNDNVTRNGGAAFDHVTATATGFDPNIESLFAFPEQLRSVAVQGDRAYIAGNFLTLNGLPIDDVPDDFAAVDAATGARDASWDPAIGGLVVNEVTILDGVVYAGGTFDTVNGGVPRPNLAAFPLADGATPATALPFDPRPDGSVEALAGAGSVLYAGGFFTGAGGVPRERLAAIDLDTGRPTPWAPRVNQVVDDLAVANGAVYAVGDFTEAEGQPRGRGAAFDAATGGLSPWDPGANGNLDSVATADDGVFVGGAFTTLGNGAFGQERLAKVDAVNGTGIAAFDAGIDEGEVFGWRDIAVSDGAVFVAADFETVNDGTPRTAVARLDAATGVDTGWDAGITGDVFAVEPAGDRVYLGGSFVQAGGAARGNGAAFTAAAPAGLLPWDPQAENSVRALGAAGPVVYVGGFFDDLAGQGRDGVGSVDAEAGAPTPFAPELIGSPQAIGFGASEVVVGGDNLSAPAAAHHYLLVFDDVLANVVPPSLGGQGAIGATLTCDPGQWTGEPALARQWLRNGAPIGGASGETYVVQGADAGTAISCRVTATNDSGSSSLDTVAVDVPPPPPPAPPAAGAVPPAPATGAPVCNPTPTRSSGSKGKIRLTLSALVIQQRIDAAALRRLNAANAWIDEGIVPTDLCAGSFGPGAFQAGISFAGGGPIDTAPPSPRALRIIKKQKPKAAFTVSRRQIVINDRISRALFARARATEARIGNLTGGNLAQGAKLTGRPLWPGLATTGPLPASQTTPATPLRIGPLPRAGGITVSAAQLRRTQRRSQQAIRIANRVNDRITQGLTEAQFRPGSIGGVRLG